MSTVANNVQCAISSVGAADTSITITNPTAPLNLPSVPTTYGIAVLIDSLHEPSQVEVIHYTGLTDNGNGTHTLTGVTRAQESTTAQAFTNGFLIQAPTAGLVATLQSDIAAKLSTVTPADLEITGTPSAGQVPTYVSGATFAWGDGGGGSNSFDGGGPDAVYLPSQQFDGGTP